MSELRYRAEQAPAIWHNNPVLVQLLGLSPLLAISTSVVNGVALGLATSAVLLLASVTIAASRNLFSQKWRFVFFLFVLAVYTTLIDIFLQRFYYPLYRELGIYVPLICCNLAVLLHLETHAQRSSAITALRSASITAAGYLLAIIGFAAVRELIIRGQVGSDWSLLIPQPLTVSAGSGLTQLPDLIPFARLAPTAFILLGLLLALRNALQPATTAATEQDFTPVTRARVTGKIQSP